MEKGRRAWKEEGDSGKRKESRQGDNRIER